ncbi:immunoglobulin domain-containing protein [Tenacibaculum finnmarkense]|uniref:immunoglobulin domain-containing protein n=1 Tax=Tenacibaculum finnmarkense TaxID=2781243 RepID=UPI001E50ABC8|nr:immunoglobulin domain-containing protein [Tenacibaculum finnmarkense]MCD8402961.1 immunoglobulin domain-containing protein [Tenacibaculum finnmarkense genomovar finnmarkense]
MKKKLLSITVFLFCCLSMLANNTLSNEKTPQPQINLIKSVNPPPTSLAKITLCEGEELKLTAEDAGTGATYKWTKGASTKSSVKDLIIKNVALGDAGIYTLTVTKNGCTNAVDIEVKINKNPDTPTLGNIVASCSSAGSTKISNYDANVTYIFTPTGPSVNATTHLVEGMTIGTSYTVKAKKGTCESGDSASFKNDAMLPTPTLPSLKNTVADCSNPSSTEIDNYDANVTYIFTPTGPSVNTTTHLVEGMTIGTSYTVKAKKGTCESGDSTSFKNDAVLPAPEAIIKLK